MKQNIENLSDNCDSLSREIAQKNAGEFIEESNDVQCEDEIPGTPQPFRNDKRKLNSNNSTMNVTQVKRKKTGEDVKVVTETNFFNFPLSNYSINKIKDNDRKDRSISMLSSPSMMSLSSKASQSIHDKTLSRSDVIASTSSTGSSYDGDKYRTKKFDNFKIDEVFDNSSPSPKKKAKIEEKSGLVRNSVNFEIEGNIKDDLKLSPIKIYVANPDLSQINMKLVSQMMERSKNLRLIIADLKKTK